MRLLPWFVVPLGVSALLLGCAESVHTDPWILDPVDYDDAGTPNPDPEPNPDPDPEPDNPDAIMWRDCAFFTNGTGDRVQCADIPLPLSHDDPDGPTINVFVKRIPATTDPSEGQLWLLQGGPGGAGDGLEPLAQTLIDAGAPWDIYLLDHRGTGRSERLGCPRYERLSSHGTGNITDEEWPDCLAVFTDERAGDLPHLRTTEAARDLGAIIARTRRPDEPVRLVGLSYGTYWAQRFLQLYPQKAHAVVLDSVCAPGLCDGTTYDYWYNETGRDFLSLCGRDPLCRQKLGDDPWAFAQSLFERLDAGHCPDMVAAGMGRINLRKILASLLTDWELRVFIPAVLYRLDRCTREDLMALANMMSALGLDRPIFFQAGLFSPLLNLHITFSEMWPRPAPSHEDIAQPSHDALISPDATLSILARFDAWPRYAPDPLAGQWAQTDTSMLMLNGTLDPQTPLATAEPAAAHFSGPNQHFVPIPNATHITLLGAPTLEGPSCGLSIALSFLLDPTGPVDTSCIADMPAIDFAGRPDYVMWMFDTPDIWDNTTHKAARPTAVRPPGLDRAIMSFRPGLAR